MRYDKPCDVCISSVMCCATYKEQSEVASSTFDGGWGTRWWRDVDGGAENEGWAVSVGQDGNVGVHGDYYRKALHLGCCSSPRSASEKAEKLVKLLA